MQKMKFFNKDLFGICDQIPRKLRILSRLLKKCLMENFSFCAVKFLILDIKFGFSCGEWNVH